MQIEFNAAKDRDNTEKHGVSLAIASDLDWDTLLCGQDDRVDYGEMGMIGYALLGSRLYCVVYTDRGSLRRIISLRKANTREVKSYASRI